MADCRRHLVTCAIAQQFAKSILSPAAERLRHVMSGLQFNIALPTSTSTSTWREFVLAEKIVDLFWFQLFAALRWRQPLGLDIPWLPWR